MQLPDNFDDNLAALGITPSSSAKTNLLTHIRRELTHAAWAELLDDEFIEAYTNGVVVLCVDGVRRRIFPRFFTYTADYPEKYDLSRSS